MGSARAAWTLVLATMSFATAAQEESTPELDFLEYLGSWQDTDEEWLLVSEWDGETPPERDDKRKLERKEDE
jgi:hypothetical protein